jgi:hypothetical protein
VRLNAAADDDAYRFDVGDTQHASTRRASQCQTTQWARCVVVKVLPIATATTTTPTMRDHSRARAVANAAAAT